MVKNNKNDMVVMTDGYINYNVLDNKKKFQALTSAEMLKLGEQLKNETRFSTRNLKNKFQSAVSLKITRVLSGEIPEDEDFAKIVKLYGTHKQSEKYKKTKHAITPSLKQEMVNAPVQTPSIMKKKKGSFLKSVSGFFKKTKDTLQYALQRTKKSLVVAGIFAVSLFAGKKSFDAIAQSFPYNYDPKAFLPTDNVNEDIVADSDFVVDEKWVAMAERRDAQEYLHYSMAERPSVDLNSDFQYEETPTEKHVAKKIAKAEKKQPSVKTQETSVQNDAPTSTTVQENTTETMSVKQQVLERTISRLKNIKRSNPADRNLDVLATANTFYKTFGNNADKVVLACAMSPYALNDSIHINFAKGKRSTTHNMIEYLSSHELDSQQMTSMKNFVDTHVKNNKINMDNFKSYKIKNLKQLRAAR